jgi:hypothetical protein
LYYRLSYSHDGGTTWLPLSIPLTESGYQLDTGQVAGGEAWLLRLLVSDGWHTGQATRGPFAVPRKAPLVAIGAPSDKASVREEQALVLSGAGYDLEDGPLADEAFSWQSDRDGFLGDGETLVLPGLRLSPGWHTITLKAADGDGQAGKAEVLVHVGRRIYLPTIVRG